MKKDEILDEGTGLKDIIDSLKISKAPRKILILGDYKQGKSHALDRIEEFYKKMFKTHILRLNIENNPLIGVNDFIPFIKLLNETEDLDTLNLKDKAEKIIRTASNKANIILNLFSKKSIHSSLFNTAELSILERLKTVVGKIGTNVFLCDDLDKWDWASITLMNKILLCSDETDWLNSSYFIFTASSKDKLKNIFHDNLDKLNVEKFSLRSISKHDLSEYLNKYEIAINAEKLYEFTEGNIGIISGIIDNTDLIRLSSEYVQSFLANKLNKAVSDTKKVERTLEMINKSSLAGKSFHKLLLKEINETDDRIFGEYLNYAKKSNIYNEIQSIVSFKTEYLWSILYEHNKNNFLYHSAFANAVKRVIPSNFFVRASEFLLSDSRQEAAESYFVFVVEYIKKYHKRIIIDETFMPVLTEFDFVMPLENILLAYENYFNEKFEQSKNLLVFESDNSYINYEKDYLNALILINESTLYSAYKDASLILQNYINNTTLKNNDPYLWVQTAILRLELLSELKENTGDLLSEICFILNKYANVDQQFRIELFSFKAKNNYTYSIDINYKETLSAYQFFAMEKSIPSKSHYACALVNYLSNALVMGNYKEVIERSEENAILFTVHNELNVFLSAFLNNYLLANLLLRYDLIESYAENYINYFKQLIDNIADNKISEVLYEINLGVVYFLSGQIKNAQELYNELYLKYATESSVDDYYRYFIINNYSLINNYINKSNNNEFVLKLKELNPLPNNCHFFNTRNQYLSEYKMTFDNTASLIMSIGSDCVLGKAWSFWGRPLLFTDVQFWTD